MLDRVKIKVVGKNVDYFLKEIIKKNIAIYNIEKNYHELIIIINYSDYLILKEMKTTYEITIINRYGINKYKYILKKYSIFIIFFLVGVMINVFLSNLIFKVEVIHPNKNLVKTVTKDLKELGITKYHFKVSYSKKESIKKEILEKEKNLVEWIEIEEHGTKYIIKVEERKKKENPSFCPERHIIAKKNAIIIDVSATTGEILKKKNDYVSKGEVIVSGLIHNKDTIVSKRCAAGVIYGEVWYRVKILVPKNYKEEIVLNKKRYGFSFKLFKKEYNFLNKFPTFKKEEYNIVRNNIIPIKLSFAKYQQTSVRDVTKSKKVIEKEALKLAENKIKKKLQKDEAILGKKVLKIAENNSKIEVEVFLKIKEDITDYQEITDLNIEEINEMNKKEE